MPNSITDAAVALSLMREALALLEGPEHVIVAAHLRQAISTLSVQKPNAPSSSGDPQEKGEP